MSDHSRSPETKKQLITHVLNYLRLADVDPRFRDHLAAIIEMSTRSCGDSKAWTVLKIGTAYKLTMVDLHDVKALAELLKGIWAMELLEKHVRGKISRSHPEGLEVHLAYPVKLQEELKLPIDISGMHFSGLIELEKRDLEEARDVVLAKLNDQEAFCTFLIQSQEWKEALAFKYPEASREMTEEAKLTLLTKKTLDSC